MESGINMKNIDDSMRDIAIILFDDKKRYLPLWVPLYILFIAFPYTLFKMLFRKKK